MDPQRLICPWGRHKCRLGGTVLSESQKTWIIHEMVYHKVLSATLVKKYQFSQKLLNKWVRRYKSNKVISSNKGRQYILKSPELRKIKEEMNREVYNTTIPEFKEKLELEHVKTILKERNIAKASVDPLSRRSLARIVARLGLKKGNAEQTTDARSKAVGDKLNAVSCVVAHSMMVPMTVPPLMLNSDGTSFQTNFQTTDLVEVIFDPEEQLRRGRPLKIEPVKGGSLTAFFVKLYMTISAEGYVADPVFIIADPNMPKGEIDMYEVAGLCLGVDLNSNGIVGFMETRQGNFKLYKWFFFNVLVKFVKTCRQRFDISIDIPAYFNLDGEDVGLSALKDPEVVQACIDNNIIIGKPPASTTSVTQPLDVGKIFMAAKTKKRKMKTVKKCMEKSMTERLQKVVKEHEAKYGKMKLDHAQKTVAGLQVAKNILQTTLRSDMIVESFELTGQYDPIMGGCDVEKILGQCSSKFTPEEVTKVWECLPRLKKLMLEKGELDEADYEMLEIDLPDNVGQRCRDNLKLNSRRFVFLTHPSLIQKEEKKRLDVLEVANAKKSNAVKRKAATEAKKAASEANPPKRRKKKNAAEVVEINA
jgi:hypothetical protein